MRKIRNLSFLLLLIGLHLPLSAQRYYIGEREMSASAFRALPLGSVDSVKLKKEGSDLVYHIVLRKKGNIDVNRPPVMVVDTVAAREKAREAALDEMLNEEYRKTTILTAGCKATDFVAEAYDTGKEVNFGSHTQGKVALLLFWGSWCPPCRHELLPENLPARLAAFRDCEDFVFVPVACNDTRESLDTFFADEENAANYGPVRCTLLDPDRKAFSRYALQSVPRAFVVNRKGTISFGCVGASEGNMDAVAAAIRQALEEVE